MQLKSADHFARPTFSVPRGGKTIANLIFLMTT